MPNVLRITNLSRTPLRVGTQRIPTDGSLVVVDLEDPEVRHALLQYKGLWVSCPPYWHAGSGVPSNELGSNGDFYLDKITSDIYMKENETWL